MSNNDCNLELTLVPSNPDRYGAQILHQEHEQERHGQEPMVLLEAADQRRQQMNIFYKGRICVCDVTESQAREIIKLASTGIESKPSPTMPNRSRNYHHQQLNNPMGLSMKRSLQRFLHKRKHRIESNSPYVHNSNRIYEGANS